MKRALLGIVSLAFVLFFGTNGLASAHGFASQASHAGAALAQQNPETVTVYVTKTGAKYHATDAVICPAARSRCRSRKRRIALVRARCAVLQSSSKRPLRSPETRGSL